MYSDPKTAHDFGDSYRYAHDALLCSYICSNYYASHTPLEGNANTTCGRQCLDYMKAFGWHKVNRACKMIQL